MGAVVQADHHVRAEAQLGLDALLRGEVDLVRSAFRAKQNAVVAQPTVAGVLTD